MKYIEIILKLAFLAGVIVFASARDFFFTNLVWFLGVSLLLGIVLIFNRKQSYGYELSYREVVIRRIEGIILIVFAILFAMFKVKGLI
jgi:hypothetical protein